MSHTCVFCLEGGDKNRPILHNVKCRCNFCFHYDCYERYDKKTICPICRGTVGDLYNPTEVYTEVPNEASMPYVVVEPSAPPEIRIQIAQSRSTIPANQVRRNIVVFLCMIITIVAGIFIFRALFEHS